MMKVRTKSITQIHIWYPPLLASVLYGIYVISTNFNSPEVFSWIALSKAIIQFYCYLFFIRFIDRRLEATAWSNNLKLFLAFLFGWVISLVFGLIFYVMVKQLLIVLNNQNDSIGFYHLFINVLSITVGYVLIFSMYLVTKISQKQLEAELKQSTFEKEKLHLQYELLYNKLEPHFLFNNLNTLHSLIVEENKMAEGFVMSLSKVMRYSFQSQDRESVTVEEELDILDHYVSIMKERLGDSLSYRVESIKNRQRHIIPMTLPNLMENVIKHNETGSDNPLHIRVTESEQYLEVINNVNLKETQNGGGKNGLSTINEIYQIKTGKHVSYAEKEGFFKVKIPYLP